MDSMRSAVVALILGAAGGAAWADDLRVPQDVASLKDALLTAQPGDRVIVTGGVWRNGRVLSAITLVGRSGATLTGMWEIQAGGAAVEGFAVRDGSIEIEADGVTLRRNRFVPPGNPVRVSGDVVSGLTLEGNRFARSRVEILHATDCVLRGNRFLGGGAVVYGSGTLAEDNVLRGRATLSANAGANAIVRRNTGGYVDLQGVTNADVEQNSVQGVYVRGAGALVADNRIPAGRSLVVEGDDAVVRGNRVSVVIRAGGLFVQGDRPVVTDNVVDNLRSGRVSVATWALLSVGGWNSSRSAGPVQVLRNEVTHLMLAGIRVACDEGEVASNTVHGKSAANSLSVEGDRNSVHENTIVREADIDRTADGITITGDENVLADTSVDQAPYDGVFVSGSANLVARVRVGRAGRCGITVDDAAVWTGIADCVVDGARWASLFVLGTGTTVTGGAFTGGRRVDVLDLGTRTTFVSSSYETKSDAEALRPYR